MMKENLGRMEIMITLNTERRSFGLLLLGLALMMFVIPSLGGQVYASPDETATAFVAQNIAWHGRAFFRESQAFDFPWFHPRSFVSHGEKIVPVGFLGWPFLLSLVARIFNPDALPWFGSLLILSSVWPLYQLLKRHYGWEAAWWGTAITFTVPSMLLYANRSLFPNGALLALMLWSVWLIRHAQEKRYSERKQFWFQVLIGAVCALCAAIRPTELVWLMPWWIWFGWSWRPQKKDWQGLVLGVLIIFLPLLLLAHHAYGSAIQIGYFLHDNVRAVLHVPAAASMNVTSADASNILPFGFHPRMLIKNIILFFGGWLWPWMILLIISMISAWKKHRVFCLLMIWTFAVLLFIYGSGRYLDRPGAWQASLGNSFLRYLLPVAPFFGWAFAFLHVRFFSRTMIAQRWGAIIGVFLILFGMYGAFFRDDEGVMATRRELIRYASIRQASQQWFSARDVIISDRSDKIFFPDKRVASPLSSTTEVARLAHTPGVRVGLFSRPLTQSEQDAWRAVGLEAQELMSSGRERLYRLAPLSP
ncbi:hypothetical protein EXS71_04730 [Candidatus Uhrbacteria bacterium]|nr:hypothetical protein [Candidatus Uhrbacteria bacterium]